MDIHFNTDSSVMGTEDVASRIAAQVRGSLARFAQRLTNVEVYVVDVNGAKGGADDKQCKIEARPRGEEPVVVTAEASDVDSAARKAGAKMLSLLDSHFGKTDRHQR
ncbi:HPF/RaiA family ribosome-associated protein [Croceibacterium aestuarii]|uniref:HPF/RaiA family ribosome-associated protein n=1 Tax=Croceibacterium aestuarii TaxID=3064139 RepID=UPI00272DEE40|nr:HPF/RaiA family ribosome-associated protein [Croceibacterium sp. D39]